MSKKKKANKGVIKMRDLVTKMSHGCVLNQHAPVMGDKTKYNRKPKHRRDYRNERDAGFFLITRIHKCKLHKFVPEKY